MLFSSIINYTKKSLRPHGLGDFSVRGVFLQPQEILRKISDKDAQKEIRELFEADKSEEMLEYIKTYATSVESPDEKDNRSKKHGNYTNI